jgi:hypothetical protein
VAGRSKVSVQVQNEVRRRANYLCEYCHASERWQYVSFTVDQLIGRAMVEALALNRERVLSIRAADKEIGRHPPQNDPIQFD